MTTDRPGSGGFVLLHHQVTPKIAAAPSNRPTTTLAAAGATIRFIGTLDGRGCGLRG